MKILVDMNLTPRQEAFLVAQGWICVHWSRIGEATAKDREIMSWARSNGYVVLTNDLDFPQLLAHTGAEGPSIVLLRGEPLTPEARGATLASAIRQCEAKLKSGAVVSVDWGEQFRLRLLPLA